MDSSYELKNLSHAENFWVPIVLQPLVSLDYICLNLFFSIRKFSTSFLYLLTWFMGVSWMEFRHQLISFLARPPLVAHA